MRLRVVAAGLCALALMAGCDGDPPQGPRSARDTDAPTDGQTPRLGPTTGTGCPNEPDATGSKARDRLTGDLDGDGSDEQVRLAIDESALPGCQVFVVARSSSVDGVAAISDPNISFDLGLPALDSIRPVGFGSGDDVVLVLSAGASTQFFGLASFVDGELVQITVEDGPYGNVFPYGGSAAHLEASDCAQPTTDELGFPTMVISSATGEGNRFRVERRFFGILDQPELVSQPDVTERKVVSFDELVSYPEFGEAPFAHCG